MVIDGDFTENAGIAAAQNTAVAELPTAVVCANDRIAIGVLDATAPRPGSRCPGEVSVTGYDDSLLAQLGHIDLTSVSQEPREQANRAIEAVVERLDGGRTRTGFRGAGATVGGTWDDSASTLTVSWNPTISADPAALNVSVG